jgi:hypothetical protein
MLLFRLAHGRSYFPDSFFWWLPFRVTVNEEHLTGIEIQCGSNTVWKPDGFFGGELKIGGLAGPGGICKTLVQHPLKNGVEHPVGRPVHQKGVFPGNHSPISR